jgi:hypothetical protein
MTQMQMNWGVMFGWDLLALLTQTAWISQEQGIQSYPWLNGMAVANLLAPLQPGSGASTGFTLGLRRKGETFQQCMARNANTYSMGGAAELTFNALTGTNSSYLSATIPNAVFGNNINTFLFGSTGQAGASASGQAPGLVSTAMGSALSYGRRTADIMSLNLTGIPGGPPLALSQASAGVQSALGSVGNVLNLGMSASTRLGVDAAFTAAEAIGCSISQ